MAEGLPAGALVVVDERCISSNSIWSTPESVRCAAAERGQKGLHRSLCSLVLAALLAAAAGSTLALAPSQRDDVKRR
jgi:hypothetical protein